MHGDDQDWDERRLASAQRGTAARLGPNQGLLGDLEGLCPPYIIAFTGVHAWIGASLWYK